MLFKDSNHKDFFYQALNKCHIKDSYHKALFYTLAIDKDCRNNIKDIFDYENDCIKLDCLNKGWQTSGSYKTILLSFNLWNGYIKEDTPNESSPYELFTCEYSPFFIEAIKIRYPEYLRETMIYKER